MNMNKVFTLTLLLCLLSSAIIYSNDSISITGSAELGGISAMNDFSALSNPSISEFYEEIRFGVSLSTRFRLELKPLSNMTAVLEGLSSFSGGYANPMGRYETTGLPELPEDESNSLFSIEQAWVSWGYESLNVSFGKVPVSWGSAWLVNPADRVNPRNLGSLFSDEKKGIPALTIDLALGWTFGFSGYMCFTDKINDELVSLNETNIENLPFALKFIAFPSGWEISAGFARETDSNWVVSEITGNISSLGLTLESALKLPESGENWLIKDALELSFGASYFLNPLKTEVLLEYIHLGTGNRIPEQYDVFGFIQGTRVLVAEDYLFSHISWEGVETLKADLAILLNLNDRSLLACPSLEWEPVTDLVFTLGTFFALGDQTSEFGGQRILGPGLLWKPWDDVTVSCGMKLHF